MDNFSLDSQKTGREQLRLLSNRTRVIGLVRLFLENHSCPTAIFFLICCPQVLENPRLSSQHALHAYYMIITTNDYLGLMYLFPNAEKCCIFAKLLKSPEDALEQFWPQGRDLELPQTSRPPSGHSM